MQGRVGDWAPAWPPWTGSAAARTASTPRSAAPCTSTADRPRSASATPRGCCGILRDGPRHRCRQRVPRAGVQGAPQPGRRGLRRRGPAAGPAPMREADAMDAAVSRDRARLDHARGAARGRARRRRPLRPEDALGAARRDGHRLEEGEISLRLARCDLLVDDLEGARRHIRRCHGRLPHAAGRGARRRGRADPGDHRRRRDLERAHRRHDAGSAGRPAEYPPSGPAGRGAARGRGSPAARRRRRRRARLAPSTAADRDSLAARLHETLVRARLDHARGRGAEPSAGSPPATGSWPPTSSSPPASTSAPPWPCTVGGSPPSTSSAPWRPRRRRHPHEHRAVARHLAPDQPGDHLERPRAHRDDPRAPAAAPLVAEDDGVATPRAPGADRRLEDQLAQREWTLTVGGAQSAAVAAVDADEARPATSDRDATVVEFFETGDELWTIVLDGGTDVRRSLAARAVSRPASPGCAGTCAPGRCWPPGIPMEAALQRATAASLAAVDSALNPQRARPTHAGRRHPVEHPRGRAVEPAAQPAGPPGHRRAVPDPLGPRTLRAARSQWSSPAPPCTAPAWRAPAPEIRAIRAFWSARPGGRRSPRRPVTRWCVPWAGPRGAPRRPRRPRGAEPAVLVGAAGRRAGVRARVPPTGCGRARLAGGVRRRPVLDAPRRRAARAGDRAHGARCDERAGRRLTGRRLGGGRRDGGLPPGAVDGRRRRRGLGRGGA